MTEWEFRVHDLRTGRFLGDLPVSSWSHTDKLNDSGSWSATVTPSDNPTVTTATQGITVEGRSTVTAWRNGEPLGYTGLIPRGGRRRSTGLDLAGGNLLKYLDTVLIETDPLLQFTGVDQFAMAAALVDLASTQGGGPAIDTSLVGSSGVARDQTWYRWDGKSIGEALRQKSALINGFDFDVRSELDTGVLIRRLRCWYPRRGRVYQAGTTPDFTVGGNVFAIPQISGDPDFCTHVVVVGAQASTASPTRLVAVATAQPLIDAGWPMVTTKLDINDISSQTVLQEQADGYIARFGRLATENVSVVVDPSDATWAWGTWDLGDDCRLVIDAGIHPWWPYGLTAVCRIIEHRWKWDVAFGETLELVLQGGVEALNLPPVIVPITPPPVTPPTPPEPPVIPPTPPPVEDPDPVPNPGITTFGYVDFPGTSGNFLGLPDDPGGFDDPGDKTFIWTMSVPSLTPTAAGGSTDQTVFSHYEGTDGNRGYRVGINPSGTIFLRWSTNGIAFTDATHPSTLSALGVTTNSFRTYAITHDVDVNGTSNVVRFFLWDPTDQTWDETGSVTNSGTTNYFGVSKPFVVSGYDNGTFGPFQGKIRSMSIRNGITAGGAPVTAAAGQTVFAFYSANVPADTETTFTAATGQTVTINRTGSPDTLAVPEAPVGAPAPPGGTGETLARAQYLVSGAPYVAGSSTRPAHEAALVGVNTGYSWYPGAEYPASFLSTHKLNMWWEVIQAGGTTLAAGSSDGIQVTQYLLYAWTGSAWQFVQSGNGTEAGQYIDGGADGTWTTLADFTSSNGNMRAATTLEGTGNVIRYDHLNDAGVNVVHGWNSPPNRTPLPSNTSAVHVSCWMRLVGPNAAGNSGKLVGICTSDRFLPDNSPDNYNAIGHPRFTVLTNAWQCYSMTAMTTLVAQPNRQSPVYHGTFLGSNPPPMNPLPPG